VLVKVQPNVFLTGTRGYAQAALKASVEAESEHSSTLEPTSQKPLQRDPVWGLRDRFGQAAQPTPLSKLKTEPHFAAHLDMIFQPLRFNPEIARRCLTHASHPSSINGHNAAMTFLGSLKKLIFTRLQHPSIDIISNFLFLTWTRSTSARILPTSLSHLQQKSETFA